MKLGTDVLARDISSKIDLLESKRVDYLEIGIDQISDIEKLNEYKDILKGKMAIHLPLELNTMEACEYIRYSWISFIEEIIIRAREFEPLYLNFHMGFAPNKKYQKNFGKYIENTVEFIDIIKNKFKKTNFSLENTFSKGGEIVYTGNTKKELSLIFNEHSSLWFCLDTGHEKIQGEDFSNGFVTPKIVHWSYNNGEEDEHKGVYNLDKSEILNSLRKFKENKILFLMLEMNRVEIEESLKNSDEIDMVRT